MPDIYLRKTVNGNLSPSDMDSRTYLKNLAVGEDVRVTIKKPRNIKFHRKFFSLLHLAHDNQDIYDDFDAFRYEVTLRAGFWKEHTHVTGKISYIPKSISFGSMDEIEFAELYSKSIDVILKHFMVGTDPEELARQADEYVGFV